MRSLCFALVLSVMIAAPLGAFLRVAVPVAGQPILVVSAPWGAPVSDRIREAGGVALGPVRTHMAALSDYADVGYLQRLRAQAPVLILSGAALSALCGGGLT